jgi:hypothetical protein
MPREIGTGAKAYYPYQWTADEISTLLRTIDKQDCRIVLAAEYGPSDESSSSDSAGILTASNRRFRQLTPDASLPHILKSHLRPLSGTLRGTKTELHVLWPRRSPKAGRSGEAQSWINSCFDIFTFGDISLTELDFAGDYVDRGNDQYVAAGRFEEGMMRGLRLLETVASALPPVLAVCGECGESVSMKDLSAIMNECRMPGSHISWANVFGPAYVEALGRDFLLGAPGHRVEELPNGCMTYQVTKDFVLWDEPRPSPNEVESYFRKKKGWERVRYKPVFARQLLSSQGFSNAMAMRKREFQPQALPPRHWEITDVSQIPELLKPTPTLAKEQFGVDLDYSPESLRALDGALKQEYLEDGSLDNEDIEAVSISIGTYIGEVVRRHIGGEWQITDEPPSPRLVDVPGFEWLDPIGRVEKRLVEGEAASLFDWYQSIRRHSKE